MASVGLTVALLSGCATSTQGQPSAAPPSSGGAQPTSSSTGSLPVDQPCSLLSTADLMRIGVLSRPTQDMVGTGHTCEMDNADDHIIVGIRTDVGLAGFQAAGGTIRDIVVGSHQAKQVVASGGSCLIGIGVTDSSRIDVAATGVGNTDPCPTASKVAELIEPELP